MTEYLSFDDILDDLMLEEDHPTPEALARWQERYPQYRQALADYFDTWAEQEAQSHLPAPEIDEEKIVQKGVEYAMEILRKQGRILPDTVPALDPFDQLVLTSIYLLRGQAYEVSIVQKVSEITGKQAVLGFVMVSVERLEKNHLISWREVDLEGKTRHFFTVTLQGDRALAHAKETSPEVARFLADFA